MPTPLPRRKETGGVVGVAAGTVQVRPDQTLDLVVPDLSSSAGPGSRSKTGLAIRVSFQEEAELARLESRALLVSDVRRDGPGEPFGNYMVVVVAAAVRSSLRRALVVTAGRRKESEERTAGAAETLDRDSVRHLH